LGVFVNRSQRVPVVSDRKIIDDNKMTAYTMKDVRRLGIEEVVKRAIDLASHKYAETSLK